MNVLGIDPGSHVTGWCLVKNEQVASHGVIRLSRKDSFQERRHSLRSEIVDLLGSLLDSGELVVAIEDPMSRAIGVAKKLALIKGTIEEKAIDFGHTCIDVLPSEWQALAREYGGKIEGETVKDTSLRVAKQEFGIEEQDAADAAWIAMYAAKMVIRVTRG